MICHSSNPKSSILTCVMAVHSTNHALTAVIMILKDRNSLLIKIKIKNIYAVQPMQCNLCIATHAVQPMPCNPCSATHAVQPMQCNLCIATYALQPMQSNPCSATHTVQPMQCNQCSSTHGVQPM